MGVAAILVCDPDPANRPRKHTRILPSNWGSLWHLASIGPAVLEKIFENGGQRTDDRPWLYYKLTNESKGSGELKSNKICIRAQIYTIFNNEEIQPYQSQVHPFIDAYINEPLSL